MASITCLACSVGFEDLELGRLHYKTDWHRYNLKRKVANLIPITLEKFQERIALQDKQEKESESSQDPCFCKPCNKPFSNTKAFENHIQSKKHKEVESGKVKKKGKSKNKKTPQNKQIPVVIEPEDEAISEDDGSDCGSMDSWDEACLGLEECLFSSYISADLEANLAHMSQMYGFFLPDADYISDLEGLMTYLGEKVGAGKVCLWCGKRFNSTQDVQKHMRDKGHCKLFYEGDSVFEYSDFYDYSKSYPEGQQETDPDEVISPEELESDGFSLTLPSGATIGHRALFKYYRQNLAPHNTSGRTVLPRMLQHYKALGWTSHTGLTPVQVQKKVKDIQAVQRFRSRYHMQLGVKANKMRHRFRLQNPIC